MHSRHFKLLAWLAVAASTLAILLATLHVAGTDLPTGWSFALSSGDDALATLIQNLLLFIPLGATLTLVGVRPLRGIAIGAALSFSVEFLQQWIPGRDPTVGDVVCNTVSTALGAALVAAAPYLLWPPPQRSARQALALGLAAVLVWLATGLVLRPIFPERPYHDAWKPDFNFWGDYKGMVISARLDDVTLSQDTIRDGRVLLKTGQRLQVTAIAPSQPPHRASPLVALLDENDTKVLMFFVDGADLGVRYHMKALELRLEDIDLRWRGALARVAPKDTFLAETWRGERGVCFALNSRRRCGFGYTIGDGWKLIYFPRDFPAWMHALLNVLWVAGWTVGVGWWGGAAKGRRETAAAAIGVVLLGLAIVPMMTGLKTTPITEWVGAAIGLGAGALARRTIRHTAPMTIII